MDTGVITPLVEPDLFAYVLTGLIEMLSLRVAMDDKYDITAVQTFIEQLLACVTFNPEQGDEAWRISNKGCNRLRRNWGGNLSLHRPIMKVCELRSSLLRSSLAVQSGRCN